MNKIYKIKYLTGFVLSAVLIIGSGCGKGMWGRSPRKSNGQNNAQNQKACRDLGQDLQACNGASVNGKDCVFDKKSHTCTEAVDCESFSDSATCNLQAGCNYFSYWRDTSKGLCLFEHKVTGQLACSDIAEKDRCMLSGIASEKCVFVDDICRPLTDADVRGFIGKSHINGTLYDDNGFDESRNHKDTGNHYNLANFDIDGFDPNGFGINGIHRHTNTRYNLGNRDKDGFGKDGFNAAGLNRGGFLKALLAPYAGSEAEMLSQGYRYRDGGPQPAPGWEKNGYIDKYVFNGVVYNNDLNPFSFMQNFQITDPVLAGHIAADLGRPFAVNEIICMFELELIRDNILRNQIQTRALDHTVCGGDQDDPGVKCFNGPLENNQRMIDLALAAPPLALDQQNYRNYLLNAIEAKRLELGIVVSQDVAPFAKVAPGAAQAPLMKKLLKAIENDNEVKFVETMARFYGAYGAGYFPARQGLLDIAVKLYLVKGFDNIPLRGAYLHFFLRCGLIQS